MSTFTDPVGTIRREVHPENVPVHTPGHEGPGYTIWVLGSGQEWIRIESTNWEFGWGFNSQNAVEAFTSVIGVVPGTEADRLNQRVIEGLKQLVELDPKEKS